MSKKHELIGILVSDPGEFRLPKAGLVLVEDLESRQRLVFDASHKTTRKAYEKQKQKGYHRLLEALKALDIDCIEIATNGSSADALTRYFRYREKRKR